MMLSSGNEVPEGTEKREEGRDGTGKGQEGLGGRGAAIRYLRSETREIV